MTDAETGYYQDSRYPTSKAVKYRLLDPPRLTLPRRQEPYMMPCDQKPENTAETAKTRIRKFVEQLITSRIRPSKSRVAKSPRQNEAISLLGFQHHQGRARFIAKASRSC